MSLGKHLVLLTSIFNLLAISKFVETYLWDNSSQYYLLLLLSTIFFILEIIDAIKQGIFKFAVIVRFITTVSVYTMLLAITYWVVINIPLLQPLRSFLYTLIVVSLFISVLERIDSLNVINPLNITLVKSKVNVLLEKIGIANINTLTENKQQIETALTEIMLNLMADGISINTITITGNKDNPLQLNAKYQIGDIGYDKTFPYSYSEWNNLIINDNTADNPIRILNHNEYDFLDKIGMQGIISLRIMTNIKGSIQPFLFIYFKSNMFDDSTIVKEVVNKHLVKFEKIQL